jgi:hypothetical protein
MKAVLRPFLLMALAGVPLTVDAQEAKPHRIGVIMHGGFFYAAVQGLREGLKELGLRK